jgi:hypothetical protein
VRTGISNIVPDPLPFSVLGSGFGFSSINVMDPDPHCLIIKQHRDKLLKGTGSRDRLKYFDMSDHHLITIQIAFKLDTEYCECTN